MDQIRRDRRAIGGFAVQALNQQGGTLCQLHLTFDGEFITAVIDFQLEVVGNLLDMAVKMAAQIGQTLCIIRFQSKAGAVAVGAGAFSLGRLDRLNGFWLLSIFAGQ